MAKFKLPLFYNSHSYVVVEVRYTTDLIVSLGGAFQSFCDYQDFLDWVNHEVPKDFALQAKEYDAYITISDSDLTALNTLYFFKSANFDSIPNSPETTALELDKQGYKSIARFIRQINANQFSQLAVVYKNYYASQFN